MGRKARRNAAKEGGVEQVARRPRRRERISTFDRKDAMLFALTLFFSAALLFTVQPMFAKMVLPILGGAPAVWNACLVFYQAVLLCGYLYAHLSLKWLGARRQAALHLALLLLAWISLPIRVAGNWMPPATTFPAPWLWMLLAVSLGLPLLLVSASAPMLQAWFARTHTLGRRDPYFLYAASNLGSLLGLFGYPLVMEAHLTLAWQSLSWAIGFGLLTVLIAVCAAMLWKPQTNDAPPGKAANNASSTATLRQIASPIAPPITARRRLRWIALALVPSSLLLGVTTYIASEITPMPFIFVIPLAIYLLTFVFVFAPRTILSLKWMIPLQAVLIVMAAMSLLLNVVGLREMLILGSLHLAAFFVTAMVCHGLLAADRPEPARLTEFYLWMSPGGVIGGLFSTLLAPLLFPRALEYPLMMAAACMLRPKVADTRLPQARRQSPATSIAATPLPSPQFSSASSWLGDFARKAFSRAGVSPIALRCGSRSSRWPAYPRSCYSEDRPSSAPAVAALAAVSLWSIDAGTEIMENSRSFFGMLRVENDTIWNAHQLMHGTTIHGQQSFDDAHRHEPQGYYHRNGPLGRIFEVLRPRRPLGEVGVLGLGVGTIAAYAEPGERFTFYEIDPAVERIAKNPKYFTYLADCRGSCDVVLGDARLSLQHGPPRQFDLLVADVFSSDFVPTHLMTREAMQIYFDHLKPGGLLAIHISSRYLELEPVLGRLAASVDPARAGRIWRDTREPGGDGRFPSAWVVMARNAADLGPLADDPSWKPLDCGDGPAWSDDFSNVARVMRWKSPVLHLIPWKWTKANRAADHGARAQSLLAESRFDEAIEHFRQSLNLGAENVRNHYGLARALAAKGRTEEAVDEYAEALMLDPSILQAHCDLGVALEKLGKHDDALQEFRTAVALDPTYVEAYNNLAGEYIERKEFKEAIDCYLRGIAMKPKNAGIRFHLGRTLKRLGRIDDALRELRDALPLAKEQNDAPLVEKIQAEIRRCEKWPWDDEKK